MMSTQMYLEPFWNTRAKNKDFNIYQEITIEQLFTVLEFIITKFRIDRYQGKTEELFT